MLSSLRVTLRTLARRPAVALVAIASLAIGIGVNTAAFSVVDAMFLRPPAVSDPYSLAYVRGDFRDSGMAVIDWADCQAIEQQAPAFSGAAAFMQRGGLWRNGEETLLLMVTVIGDNYFDLLGVRPALGRLPDPKHDYQSGSEPPIVLAYWFWKERMGGRMDVVGQPMELSGHLYRIAAVLPPHFRGLEPMASRHIWIPVGSWTRYMTNDLNRGSGQFEVVARLRSGATMQQAQAQLDIISKRIEQSDSKVPKGRRLLATVRHRQPLHGGRFRTAGQHSDGRAGRARPAGGSSCRRTW